MMRRLTEREGWALRQLWAEGTRRRLAWANRVQALLTAREWTGEWWDSDPCLENGRHERAPLTGWLVHLQEGNGLPPIQQAVWTVEDDGRGRGDMLTWTVSGRRGWMICYPSGEIEVQGTTRRCWVVPELQAVWVDVCEEPGSGSGAHSHP